MFAESKLYVGGGGALGEHKGWSFGLGTLGCFYGKGNGIIPETNDRIGVRDWSGLVGWVNDNRTYYRLSRKVSE